MVRLGRLGEFPSGAHALSRWRPSGMGKPAAAPDPSKQSLVRLKTGFFQLAFDHFFSHSPIAVWVTGLLLLFRPTLDGCTIRTMHGPIVTWICTVEDSGAVTREDGLVVRKSLSSALFTAPLSAVLRGGTRSSLSRTGGVCSVLSNSATCGPLVSSMPTSLSAAHTSCSRSGNATPGHWLNTAAPLTGAGLQANHPDNVGSS